MTRKGEHFQWTQQRREAFERVKQLLCEETTLAYFDPDKKTRLYVDGSKKDGVGSILAQYNSELQTYQPVRYDSRALRDAERRYSQIEVESLAVYVGIVKNHMYLYGLKHFELITDHMPLVGLYNKPKQEMPPRIKHHKTMTQGYGYTVVYEKGVNNPSDYMSRHPLEDKEPMDEAMTQWDIDVDSLLRLMIPDAITTEQMQEATMTCPEMKELKSAIERGYIDKENKAPLKPYTKIFTELSIEEDLILRGERIVVPEKLRKQVVQIAHESHLGIVKTKQLIKETMWFPNIDRWVDTEIHSCLACQAVTATPSQEPLKCTELPEEPWSSLVTDFYGPLPTGE